MTGKHGGETLWQAILLASASALLLALSFVLSQSNYLLFHSIVEILSIGVAMAIFAIGWHTRRFADSPFLLILSVALLCVAMIDMVHALAYEGMGVFPGRGEDLPTQLWIAARYLTALAVLVAVFFLGRPFPASPAILLVLSLILTGLLILAIFIPGGFPSAYNEAAGRLTPFKIISEYVISALLFISGLLIWRKRLLLDGRILLWFTLFLLLTVLSEMSFTLYTDVYGSFNAIGHILKIMAFLALYMALIRGSLENPFQVIFRDLESSRLALSAELAERQRAEAERESILAQLDATITAIADGVIIYGPEGEIIRLNPAAMNMLGYTPEVLNYSLSDRLRSINIMTEEGLLFPIEASPPARALQGETVKNVIMEAAPPGKSIRWLLASAAPISGAGSGFRGAVASFTDITPLRTLQQEQENLLHSVSHDLRAPLTLIQGHTQLMQKASLEGKAEEGINSGAPIILKNVRRMNIMIEDLVDSARLASGQIALSLKKLDLVAFLRTFLEEEKEIVDISRVRLQLPEGLPPVEADPDRLQRIMVNLLSNALKYSDGDISISAAADKDMVRVSVADRGKGIAPRDLGHVFDRFYRAHGAAGQKEGLGLGLYITKGLVEAHGGSIRADSLPGKGSIFSFTLKTTTEEQA